MCLRYLRRAALRVAADVTASVLSDCRLTYFGIPGRAEAIRLAFAIGSVEFEDNLSLYDTRTRDK